LPSRHSKATSLGGPLQNSDYYIDDFGGGTTNWFPDSSVAANAGYVLFLPQDHGAVKITGIGMVQTNNVTMQMPYSSTPWAGLAYPASLDMRNSGLSGLFTEGDNSLIRDPMVIRIGDDFHCYYCDTPQRKKGYINVRTSTDLKTWSDAKTVSSGGVAGTGFTSSECPFVINYDGWYYLFRTQGYPAPTRIYRSQDPLNFGINDDQFLLGTLPLAAPEIIEHEGQTYIASLLPSLKGIRIAKLECGSTKETR
jgi:hypothetical protein